MALLTPMTLDDAQVVGETFGLAVTGLSPIAQGSVNSNFALELAGGERRFLRLCEESSHDEVRAQNALLAHLVGRGVPTPAPLVRVDGKGTVATFAGKPAVVFPFVPGKWVPQKEVTAEHLITVGEALAAVHLAGADYPDAPPSRFDDDRLDERVRALAEQKPNGDIAAALKMIAIVRGELKERRQSPPAPTVIHGDVFRDNVLWQGHDLAAIVDFESASLGHPMFDLMVTMHAWCFTDRFEPAFVRALMAGYQSRRPLDADALAACYDEARAAAVRFAITRITDYELRPRDVVIYKDYRRFMARLEALEMIGAAAFPGWLGE